MLKLIKEHVWLQRLLIVLFSMIPTFLMLLIVFTPLGG